MAKKNNKILVIDDDSALANAIKLVLENEGYDTDAALDSTTALEMVKEKEYEILLCDYNLPDIKGLEFIEKALEVNSKSVPVMITGVSSMELALDGMRLGVHDYLVKPIDYDELRKIVKTIIDERRQFEEGQKKLKDIIEEKPSPSADRPEKRKAGKKEDVPSGEEAEKAGEPEKAAPEKTEEVLRPDESGSRETGPEEKKEQEPVAEKEGAVAEPEDEAPVPEEEPDIEEETSEDRVPATEGEEQAAEPEEPEETEDEEVNVVEEERADEQQKKKEEEQPSYQELPAGTTSAPEEEEQAAEPEPAQEGLEKPAEAETEAVSEKEELPELKAEAEPVEQPEELPADEKEEIEEEPELPELAEEETQEQEKKVPVEDELQPEMQKATGPEEPAAENILREEPPVAEEKGEGAVPAAEEPPADVPEKPYGLSKPQKPIEDKPGHIAGRVAAAGGYTRPAQPDYASSKPSAGGHDSEKDKTIFDFVLDKSDRIKKNIRNGIIVTVLLCIAFAAADTLYFKFTPLGKKIHDSIWPPALIIDSIPSGAQVDITGRNGVNIVTGAATPVEIPKIAPGTYSLKMEMSGYSDIERKITIYGTEGKTGNISLQGDYRNLSSNETQKYVIPFEIPVTINSNPSDAVVYVDGKKMGNRTPLTVNLTADLHTIMLEKEGFPKLGNTERYETYGQCNLDLTGLEQDGIDSRYWAVTSQASGMTIEGVFWKEVRIESNPSGAQFIVDGDLLGLTPADTRMKVGKHSLVIKKPGYSSWEGTIDVLNEQKKSVYLYKQVTFVSYEEGNPGKDIGARVWIEGTRVHGRETPFKYKFRPGIYSITYKKEPGYVPETRSIKISDQNRISMELQKKKIFIEITVIDAVIGIPVENARVSIQEKERGFTSAAGIWKGEVSSGEYAVSVYKPGFEEVSLNKVFTVQDKTLEIELEPVDRPLYQRETIEPAGKTGEERAEEKTKEKEKRKITVIIDTRPNFPGAAIFLDGEFEGETVRRIPDVIEGTHEIEIEHPYIGKKTQDVKIEAGDEKDRVIINFNSTGEVEIR